MYHYVRDLKKSRFPRIKGLNINLFKEQIKYILKYYQVITMQDLLEALEKRKKSISYYLFSEKFFKDHFNKLNDNIFWLGAHYQNKLIAGAVFLKSADFLHYYFAGSDSQYFSLSPGTLILWEAIKIGKKLGLCKFNLGGGIDDKLFFYKTGFSDNRADFYTGEIIHNPQIYELLTQKNDISEGNYFPLYRQLSSKT